MRRTIPYPYFGDSSYLPWRYNRITDARPVDRVSDVNRIGTVKWRVIATVASLATAIGLWLAIAQVAALVLVFGARLVVEDKVRA